MVNLRRQCWGLMMVGNECPKEATDVDRRRFLVLSAKLGIAAPPAVTLALTNPSYAAASGFTPPPPAPPSQQPTRPKRQRRDTAMQHEGRGPRE
jgi:hypothetical protein